MTKELISKSKLIEKFDKNSTITIAFQYRNTQYITYIHTSTLDFDVAAFAISVDDTDTVPSKFSSTSDSRRRCRTLDV